MHRVMLFLMLSLATLLVTGTLIAQDNADDRFVGQVEAPAFPADIDWLNTDNPLTLDGLQGKIVILDFWTYGCINCIHMLPVLEQIAADFNEEIVIVSVHSAKFENEGETENIRQIVQRYNIKHPVINDSDFRVWRSYGVQAWPTFVIIDPLGNVVARQPGEVPYDAFNRYLSEMITYWDAFDAEAIDRTPLEFALEGAGDPGTLLLYPGKVLADPEGGRLFIADSNHHRIVVADLETYDVLATIGTGERGLTDGDYATAQFNQPQGMSVAGNTLYIADTSNHAIRAVDLSEQTVTTLAGTGEKGQGIPAFDTMVSDPLEFALRSPWDVLADGSTLHIAMAGTHQLWIMDLDDNTLQASVGNGREAQRNQTLATSELAQPSGLHLHDGRLYFADSESSTIRVADLINDEVRVIAGTTDNSLFDFGDVDGVPGESRLQHALGVTGNPDGDRIYIADTYNNKIKVYDVSTQETITLFGQDGNGGFTDGGPDAAAFDEPGGLDYADGRLYVADTNNHAVRVIDLEANTVSTVQFPNPEALKLPERNAVTIVGGNQAAGMQIALDAQTVTPGATDLTLTIAIPEGYKLNDLTTSTVEITSGGAASPLDGRYELAETTLTVPLTLATGAFELTLETTIFYCEADNEAFCLIEDVTFTLPLTVTDDPDDNALRIEHAITPPEIYEGGF